MRETPVGKEEGYGEGATPKSPTIRKIAEIPELGMFGTRIYLIELPDRNPEDWFISPLTGWKFGDPPLMRHPSFIPLKNYIIEWKKKFGEPSCYVLIKWGCGGFILKRYEEINPKYISGISLREALREEG
jgi:hypothetical protein